MAAPLFLPVTVPLMGLRLHRYRFSAGILTPLRRPWSTTAESAGLQEELSTVDKTTVASSARYSLKYPIWDDPDYRKWKDKEDEILSDIEPITILTKEILHSGRYFLC